MYARINNEKHTGYEINLLSVRSGFISELHQRNQEIKLLTLPGPESRQKNRNIIIEEKEDSGLKMFDFKTVANALKNCKD